MHVLLGKSCTGIPPHQHCLCLATSFAQGAMWVFQLRQLPAPIMQGSWTWPRIFWSSAFFSIHRDVTASRCPRSGAERDSSQQTSCWDASGSAAPSHLLQVPGNTLSSQPRASPGPPPHPTREDPAPPVELGDALILGDAHTSPDGTR